MKMSIKGIHKVKKRLKSGEVATYYYASRGGERLKGVPGSDEFLESLAQAKRSARKQYDEDTVGGLIDRYRKSHNYVNLKDKTKLDYDRVLSQMANEFASMPIIVLDDPKVRKEFKDFRESFLPKKRTADNVWMVMKRVFSTALDDGIIRWNPCAGGGKFSNSTRAEIIWLPTEIENFKARAPNHLVAPFLCALDTGQRQGTILKLQWNNYDGTHFKIKQGKPVDGEYKMVKVRVSNDLKRILDGLKRTSTNIFTNSRGLPWTSSGFGSSFSKACDSIGITGRTFHDTRGTFITLRSAEGSTVEEIASISGHSTKDVTKVLEKHYLAFNQQLSDAVILRMDKNK